MQKILLLLMLALIPGCVGTIYKRPAVVESSAPDVVESFDVVDADGNGTITKGEYYANAVSINTEQPIVGLGWIVLSVLVCAFGAAIVYRRKSE